MYCVPIEFSNSQRKTQQNRSNSPFRASETTIHNNWGRFTFISTLNWDIPWYNFTIVRLFNILNNQTSRSLGHAQKGCRWFVVVFKVACKLPQTINSLFPRPKERDDSDRQKSGIVYKINCTQCNFVYYRQTERSFKTRIRSTKRQW